MKISKFIKGSVAAAVGVSLTTGICAIALAQNSPTTASNPLDVFDNPIEATSKASVAFEGSKEGIDTVSVGSWMHYSVNPAMQVQGLSYGFKWSNTALDPNNAPFKMQNASDPTKALTVFATVPGNAYNAESEISMFMETVQNFKLKLNSVIYKNGTPLCGTTTGVKDKEYDIHVVAVPTVAWNVAKTDTKDLMPYYCNNGYSGTTVASKLPQLSLTGYGPWKVSYTIQPYYGDGQTAGSLISNVTNEIGVIGSKPGDYTFVIPDSEFDISGYADAATKGVRFEVTVTAVSDRFVRKALNSKALASSINIADKLNIVVFPSSDNSLPVIHVKNQ